jgi:glycerol uptake facilitator-like aquaporin
VSRQKLISKSWFSVYSALTVSLCLVDLYLDNGHKVGVHVTRAVMHVISQVLGSLLGAILVVLLIPGALDGFEHTGVGVPALASMTSAGAFFLEFFFSIFLVLVLLSVRNNENKKSSMILVFAMVLIRIVLFPTTGSTLNPNRALAHAIVGDGWTNAWIFLVSPIFGATAATAGFIWMHRQDME